MLVLLAVALPGCFVAAPTRSRRALLVAGALLLRVPATGVPVEELGATGSFSVVQ